MDDEIGTVFSAGSRQLQPFSLRLFVKLTGFISGELGRIATAGNEFLTAREGLNKGVPSPRIGFPETLSSR